MIYKNIQKFNKSHHCFIIILDLYSLGFISHLRPLRKYPRTLALVRPSWYVYPMKKSEKPQRQKANVIRVQELRRSNATSRHKSVMDYRRKPKHPNRGWGE